MTTKSVAIRLDEDIHAQLAIIAQLRDTSLTEEIRSAIETHIGACKDSGELTTKADEVLADIERDAQARRSAIESLFSSGTATKATRSRKPKSTSTESSAS